MNQKQCEMCENVPDYAKDTARLFSWSENYDFPTPATLYLDLIGYSDEQFGEPMFKLENCGERLGYLELDMLADALKEYASRPQDVYKWVEDFLASEVEDEDGNTVGVCEVTV